MFRRAIALAAVGLMGTLLAACGAAPVQPSEAVLRIQPQVSSIAVGQSIDFRLEADGQTRTSRVVWSVAGPSALVAGSTVTGGLPGAATLIATLDGHSTALALAVVPNVAGVWSGTLHQPTCIKVSGAGPFYCTKTPNGWTNSFSMALQQTGEELVITRINFNSLVNEGLSVTGHIGIDGTLTLPAVTLLDDEGGSRVLAQWSDVVVDPKATPVIAGSVQLDEFFFAIGGPQHYSNKNFISLHR